MHDRRQEISARLQRVLEERVRPAVHTSVVPLEVAVWHVPTAPDGLVGDPVPFAVARDASYAPVGSATVGGRPGARRGSA